MEVREPESRACDVGQNVYVLYMMTLKAIQFSAKPKRRKSRLPETRETPDSDFVN